MAQPDEQDDWLRLALLPLLRHAWVHMLDPRGRSRRSEIAACMVLPLLVNIAAAIVVYIASVLADWDWPPEFDDRAWGNLFLGVLQFLPLPALMARRFHDFGRTAWLALPLVPMLLLGLYQSVRDIQDGPYAIFKLTDAWAPFGWILPMLSFAFLLAMLVPGTRGTNAYGPDPRDQV